MAGPLSYPILYVDNVTPIYDTYGTVTLNAGTATVSSRSIASNSKILLCRKSYGTTPGSVRFSNISNGFFVLQSNVATDNGSFFYLILKPSSDIWFPVSPIALPLIIGNQMGGDQSVGIAQLSSGTVTVNNAFCKTNSLIFLTRRGQGTGFNQGAITAFSAINNGSFTITSTVGDDDDFYQYLILTPADISPPTSSVNNIILPALDSTVASATYGEATLSGGFVIVNTTASKTSPKDSNIFINKSSGASNFEAFAIADVQPGYFYVVSSNSVSNSNIFWWLINTPS